MRQEPQADHQLIEMLDNANNMAILKLWQPLLGLLKSDQQPVVAHACWIIGTAVQNNLKAQAAVSSSCISPSSFIWSYRGDQDHPPVHTLDVVAHMESRRLLHLSLEGCSSYEVLAQSSIVPFSWPPSSWRVRIKNDTLTLGIHLQRPPRDPQHHLPLRLLL